MQPGATSLNSNMIRDGHPACRLKPASPAVPAASAKEENKNNNDEKCLGIHDVQPFQCDGSGLGFSTISAFARMHIIWGDAIVPASPRSASSCAGRCFCLPRRISIRSAVMVARSTMSRTRLFISTGGAASHRFTRFPESQWKSIRTSYAQASGRLSLSAGTHTQHASPTQL
jgi:hypothetical protein